MDLTARPADPIKPSAVIAAQAQVNGRLAKQGARLSGEQQVALKLAAGERRVVMVEGQAGTGKSTVLQAVALAHQAEGRQVIVTSTGALAAQRLAADLADAGVPAPAYSTAAFGHAVRTGRLDLNEQSTVIHDEAALASTREQHQIFTAVRHADARLVLVGDPEQNKPVGAGGLWQHLETQLQDGGRAELTINLRAQDPADQIDQARFRNGHQEQALASYQQRVRLWLDSDLAGAEGLALIFAHADRQAGKRTLVIAQTSNDHLDELNAQAQARRIMYDELGAASLPIPGRPYAIHPGDQVQIRNGIRIADHGRVSNGTEATVVSISPENGPVALRLSDGSDIALTRAQVIEADTRLAYVQHPFPAQGSTVDTAHLVVGEHASREGSYVAITRARQETHIYADRSALQADPDRSTLSRLAEIMASDEPEVPSIVTPLATELVVQQQAEDSGLMPQVQQQDRVPQPEGTTSWSAARRRRDDDQDRVSAPQNLQYEETGFEM